MSSLNKGINPAFPVILCMTIAIFAAFSGCIDLGSKDDGSDMAPDNWLDRSYSGTLTVRYTNVYPEWDVSTSMKVEIEKEFGTIEIDSATLTYSGETLVSPDSKIERSGSWNIGPSAFFEGDTKTPSLSVDAGITVVNDVQRIYAKDQHGEWQLVNEMPFSETPSSDLLFSFNEALSSGAVISVSTEGGSMTWTLVLIPHLD
ncbi:MAG: hypothetical protein QCI82_02990 [Candidatus Thermoplasmatota archaeon]|nr:hypothetical protein [Candidatus Thermoplasmatota archaeon]